MNYHLELKGVRKQFGPTEIIRGVNLNIKKGEIHSLIGPNGAGKSTLYNLISGVYKLSSGSIKYNNKNFNSKNLLKQDKGQLNCTSAFINSVKQGGVNPIPINQIFEVQKILLDCFQFP